MNVSEHIVDRLRAWGVHRVYGYPGDGIGGVLVALSEASDDVEFIQVRHEETAGFAATADVKYGRRNGADHRARSTNRCILQHRRRGGPAWSGRRRAQGRPFRPAGTCP